MGSILAVFVFAALPFVCLGVTVALTAFGVVALAGGIRGFAKTRGPAVPGSGAAAASSPAPTFLVAGGTIALGLAVLVGIPTAVFVNEMRKSVRQDRKRSLAERGIDDDLRRIGAAEAAYRRANGGFYDRPACLARPGGCIPGYAGPPLLDPELASLKPRRGYVLTFAPGPEAPAGATRGSGVSASSLTGYAIVAKTAEFGEGSTRCVDARSRPCAPGEEGAKRGVCTCTVDVDGTRVYPLVIEFTHTVGAEYSCPRHVANLGVSNGSHIPITTDIRTLAPAPLSFGPNVTLKPQESSGIDIFYTCASKDSFAVDVVAFKAEDIPAANAFESKTTVYGTIVR